MNPSSEYIARTGKDCLYNLTAIKNLASIMQLGILSHNQAKYIDHSDISNRDVQNIRADVVVDIDRGRMLHDYANL